MEHDGCFYAFKSDTVLWYDAERVAAAEVARNRAMAEVVPLVLSRDLLLPGSRELARARKRGEVCVARGLVLVGDDSGFSAKVYARAFWRRADLETRAEGPWNAQHVEDCEGPWLFVYGGAQDGALA